MEPTPDEIRQWLRELLRQSGETPTALARKAGLAPSTLTRFLDDDQGKAVLSFRSVSKLAHATGQDMPMTTARITPRPPGFSEPDAQLYVIERESQSRMDRAILSLQASDPATDPWVMSSDVLEDVCIAPGDILLVNLNGTPHRGNIVCAQIYQWAQGKAETIFRVYEPPYLVASIRKAAGRKPYLVDDEHVAIKGVVTHILRTCIPKDT